MLGEEAGRRAMRFFTARPVAHVYNFAGEVVGGAAGLGGKLILATSFFGGAFPKSSPSPYNPTFCEELTWAGTEPGPSVNGILRARSPCAFARRI